MSSATTPDIDPDRLAALDELTLHEGGHNSFESGHCAMEVVAWLAGQGHTDAPSCASPVLRDFTIRLNDRWNHEKRQALKPHLPRMVGTGDDGHDDARRVIARQALADLLDPWLCLAGLDDKADALTTVDMSTPGPLNDLLWSTRDAAWAARRKARDDLRDRVRTELKKRGVAAAAAAAVAVAAAVTDAAAVAATDAVAVADADAATDAVAVAAAAADAAAATDAATDAAAAAAAVAVAVAVAVTDAAAAAVADAAAVTDAAAAATDAAAAAAAAVAAAVAAAAAAPGNRHGAAYRAAAAYFRENPLPIHDRIRALGEEQAGAALVLLDRLIDPAKEATA